MSPRMLLIVFGLLIFPILQGTQSLQFFILKLECEVVDREFGAFKECSVHKRGPNKGVNVHFQMFQKNVTNITVNAGLYRKSNGFKPFLYNDTIDFCDFVANSKRHIFWNYIYSVIRDASNINHTCPYNHDLVVTNFLSEKTILKVLPFPTGEYMLAMDVAAFNVVRGKIRVFATNRFRS